MYEPSHTRIDKDKNDHTGPRVSVQPSKVTASQSVSRWVHSDPGTVFIRCACVFGAYLVAGQTTGNHSIHPIRDSTKLSVEINELEN